MPSSPTIGILAAADEHARASAAVIERLGGIALRIDVADGASPTLSLRLVDALVCADDCGQGDDALALLRAALDDDMPAYALGGGLHLLNTAFGGKSAVPVSDHGADSPDSDGSAGDSDDGNTEADTDSVESAYHHIYIAPGSRLAAVVGSGGFVRVNSRHAVGLREAQKSPLLLASAYSLEDGVIEALESARHRWVIGVQFRPERRMELPPHFDRLFQSLLERAVERAEGAYDGA